MNKLTDFFKSLTKSDSNDSSKRFLAIYVTLVLITFIVLLYTNENNNVMVLTTLCGFVLALIGVLVAVIGLVSFSYVKLLQKSNNKRHEDHETTIKVLTDNQTELKILSAKYDTKLESHQGQISQNRRNIEKQAS